MELEFLKGNTYHHHVLLWLERGIIEDPGVIEGIIRAGLTCGNSAKETELVKLIIKKLNVYKHSPYRLEEHVRNPVVLDMIGPKAFPKQVLICVLIAFGIEERKRKISKWFHTLLNSYLDARRI